MHTVEITRKGDAPVLDQLAEMHQWLRRAGINVVELEAVSIIKARVLFRATFVDEEDAERFRRWFDTPGAADPG